MLRLLQSRPRRVGQDASGGELAPEEARQGGESEASAQSARAWTKGVLLLLLFALAGFAFAAGGLGVAPVVALGGLCALAIAAFDGSLRRLLTPGLTAWAGAALLGWAAITLLWSPYDHPSNLLRVASGAAASLVFFQLCRSAEGPGRRLARAGVLLSITAAGAFFAFELGAQGVVTAAYRADALDPIQVWRNLGHGLSAWLVVLPAALLSLPWRDPAAATLGTALLLIAAACSVGFGLTSNLAGLLAGIAGAAAAARWPRMTVRIIGAVGALTIVFAPLLALLSRATPASLRAAMPDSWEARLEVWSYAVDRIAEKPIQGWGFDAARTMTDTILFRGEPMVAMPLHPHNAGLHLWLETGLVGAALTATVVLLMARRVAAAPGLGRRQAMAAAAAAAGYIAMAQVSYGVWQAWWIATVGLGAAAAALAGPSVRAAGKAAS